MHDRYEIKLLLDKGYSRRSISRALEKSSSVVSDEIKRNGRQDGFYNPILAQLKAGVRRNNASYKGKTIVVSPALRQFVEINLLAGQTPVAIAGRLQNQEINLPYVSKDSIYRYRQSPYGKMLGLKRKIKKRKNGYKKNYELNDRKFLNKRPKIVNLRNRVGDLEGDFIVSGKAGKGVLLVVVDRKLRFVWLEIIYKVTIKNIHQSFLKIKARFPSLKTLTLDNDILFRHHQLLAKLLGVKIYFCQPFHSWEKGSVENVNKQIRKFIPKGSDLSRYTPGEIQEIEQYLNNRFMKCLNYQTPTEVLTKYLQKQKNNS